MTTVSSLERVTVVEVGPRDGLQNDPAEVPTAMKAELISKVIEAGITRVEAVSFVSAKAVPKMADAESLIELLREREIAPRASLIGLVVNDRGVKRAVAAGVDEVNVVVVVSDTFSRRNQGMGTEESLDRLIDLAGDIRAAGLRMSVTLGASFGCPFEGEVPIGRLEEIVSRVGALAPDEIALADSIGVAVPADIGPRFAVAQRAAGPEVVMRAHFHNTRNTGIANAAFAVQAGVRVLDASLGGVGGCPFAPRATGNIATEDLAYLLERSGIATGPSLHALIDASHWFEEALNHPLPGMLAKAGPFPTARKDIGSSSSC